MYAFIKGFVLVQLKYEGNCRSFNFITEIVVLYLIFFQRFYVDFNQDFKHNAVSLILETDHEQFR